jgi:hypothetical protein
VALRQSHVNQLHKIIASAEMLISEIERAIQSQSSTHGSAGRSGTSRGKTSSKTSGKTSGKNGGSSRSRASAKADTRSARGRKTGGGQKASRGSASGNAGARRNRAQTAEFRQSILKELQGGTPVADLAAKHGVTPAYVYQIKSRAEA